MEVHLEASSPTRWRVTDFHAKSISRWRHTSPINEQTIEQKTHTKWLESGSEEWRSSNPLRKLKDSSVRWASSTIISKWTVIKRRLKFIEFCSTKAFIWSHHSPKSVDRMRKLHGGTISHARRVNLTMPCTRTFLFSHYKLTSHN